MIHSYATVFQLGHKMIADIFSSPVVLEEKIDGSQVSFGIVDGELQVRSKGKQLILDAPEKMFTKAVATAQELSSFRFTAAMCAGCTASFRLRPPRWSTGGRSGQDGRG